MQIKKIFAAIIATAVAGTMALAASAEVGGIGFQTGNWVFRNSIEQSKVYVCDQDYANENEPSDSIFGEDMFERPGTFNDVEITGDGSYTASITGLDGKNMQGAEAPGWNVIKFYTNISLDEYPNVSITIDSFKIDGKEIFSNVTYDFVENDIPDFDTTVADKTCADNPENLVANLACIPFYNMWNNDGNPITTEMAADLAFGSELTVDFTVKGLTAADPEPEAPADPEPEAPADPEPEAPANPGDSSKPNAGTGVEGIALVAGIAVLATGAVVVSKKRK